MDQVIAPKGVYAAVATPFDSDGQPDHRRYIQHCQWLLKHGCDGLAPLGTTGEATSIGLATRVALIKGLHQSGLPMNRMIIGTGSTSVEDTVILSITALQAGAAGLLMLPPFNYGHLTENGLFNYFANVAKQLMGHHRPQIYLYHIPINTGIDITVELVARLRAEFPHTFVGIKDSGPDFSHTARFIKAFPGFAAFSGTEVFVMNNLIAGGWGCISATANMTAPAIAHRVNNRSRNNQTLSKTINLLRQRMMDSPSAISAIKRYLALYKQDPDWARTLPPHTEADDVASFSRLFESLQPIDELLELYDGIAFADQN